MLHSQPLIGMIFLGVNIYLTFINSYLIYGFLILFPIYFVLFAKRCLREVRMEKLATPSTRIWINELS